MNFTIYFKIYVKHILGLIDFAIKLRTSTTAWVRRDRITLLVALNTLLFGWLQLTGEAMCFTLIQYQQTREPTVEKLIFGQMVGICSALQQFNLGQHFELFTLLIEVDEIVGANRIRNSCMNHRQIRQKSAQIRNRSMAYMHVLWEKQVYLKNYTDT